MIQLQSKENPLLEILNVCAWQVLELHRAGADLVAVDQYGMTALHHAARFGHKDIVKYLIDQGTTRSTTLLLQYSCHYCLCY